jgi:hypothetical protein
MGDIDRSEASVSAAMPHCLKCEGGVLLAAMISDVRRGLIVRLYQCECGELIWEEKSQELWAAPATSPGFVGQPRRSA